MKPYLEAIMRHVQRGLQNRGLDSCFTSPQHRLYLVVLSRKKPDALVEQPILQCITALAASVGPLLTESLSTHIGLIFTCELSEVLVSALSMIGRNVPELLGDIQGLSD